MTIPVGSQYKDGFWWTAEGIGPCVYNGSALVPLAQYSAGAGAGALTAIGRLAGGMILNYTDIISNGTTIIKAGATLYGGLLSIAPGTAWTLTAYDNIAASGVVVVPAGTAISGTGAKLAADCCPAATGIILTNGLTIVTAGTTPGRLRVLWA